MSFVFLNVFGTDIELDATFQELTYYVCLRSIYEEAAGIKGFIQAGGELRGTAERGSNLSSNTYLPALLGTRNRVSSRPFQNDVSTGPSLGFNKASELTFALRKGRLTGDHLSGHLDCAKKQGSCGVSMLRPGLAAVCLHPAWALPWCSRRRECSDLGQVVT